MPHLRSRTARRGVIRAEIGPLSGLAEQTPEAYESLRALTGTGPGGFSAQFLAEPPVERPGWSLIRGGLDDADDLVRRRGSVDYAAARSGRVAASYARRRPRDGGVGRVDRARAVSHAYTGARRVLRYLRSRASSVYGGAETAAAWLHRGQRSVHPSRRARPWYARTAMSEVMADILGRGAIAVLHAFADNPAIRVYEALGFSHRRGLHLAVFQAE